MRTFLLGLALWLGLSTPLAAQLREAEESNVSRQHQSTDQKARRAFPSLHISWRYRNSKMTDKIEQTYPSHLVLDTAQWGIASVRVQKFKPGKDTTKHRTWAEAVYSPQGFMMATYLYQRNKLVFSETWLSDNIGRIARQDAYVHKQGHYTTTYGFCADTNHKFICSAYMTNNGLPYAKAVYQLWDRKSANETKWAYDTKLGKWLVEYKKERWQDTTGYFTRTYQLVDKELKLVSSGEGVTIDSLFYSRDIAFRKKDTTYTTYVFMKNNIMKERSYYVGQKQYFKYVYSYDFANNIKTTEYFSDNKLHSTSKSYISWACDPTEKKQNVEGQTVSTKGDVSTYAHYYDDSADCRQRVYEQKDNKGRVTYKHVTQLDATNKPLREDTYDRKGKHVSSIVYSYTYY